MSEEEEKAIDRIYAVTHCINGEHTQYIDIDNIANDKEDFNNCEGFCEAIDIVLKLIGKQQLEIEQLKYSITKATEIIDEYANETEEDTKKLIEYQEKYLQNW